MAALLVQRDGSVAAAFEQRSRSHGQPPMSSGGSLPSSPTGQSVGAGAEGLLSGSPRPMNQDEFLKLLRMIKVLGDGHSMTPRLNEQRAVDLFWYLPEISVEGFKERLEQLHSEEQRQKEDQEQQRARAEQ